MSDLMVPGPKGLIVPEHVAQAAAKARLGVTHIDMIAFANQVFAAMRDKGLMLGGFVPKPPEGLAIIVTRMDAETRTVSGHLQVAIGPQLVADAVGRSHQIAKQVVDDMLARFAEADEAAARERANPQMRDEGGEG